jgi:alcohol dehydrogenase
LTLTQPLKVRARAGYDAISHAVETWVTTKRCDVSAAFSREAATLLIVSFERVLEHPEDVAVNGDMLLGAFYAGAAIEHSMLGAAHALANPITARYGTEHGAAIAHMLPYVVRWNGSVCASRYAELAESVGLGAASSRTTDTVARRLEELATAAGLATRLGEAGIERDALPELAADAAEQWTGQFNPRPFDAPGALEVYECAY